jgi:TonB family protein
MNNPSNYILEGTMKIQNILAGKVVAAVVLLTASVCWGFQGNKPLVYGTIHEAAKNGDLADVKNHLARGANVNAKNEWGQTPLFLAATKGNKDVAELLIAKGADVNAKDIAGATTLYLAVAKGLGHKDLAELVELLIAKGADVNAENKLGMTPLQYAEIAEEKDIVEILKKHGARENQPSGSLPSHPPEPESTEPSAPLRILGDMMSKPKIIKQVDPIYPEDAIIAKVEGIVIIEATTDEQGKVIDAKILRSVPLLDKAALAAVKQWIYEPYIYAGKPRPIIFTVTVRFNLKKTSALFDLPKDFSHYDWIALRGAGHYT